MLKVVIGIPTSELARVARFYDYLFAIDKPEGTTISLAHGSSPAENRNSIIKTALEADATHIFFVDDDMMIPADALKKMLEHDKDVVSGLYLHRNFPHAPIAFNVALSDGRCRFKFLQSGETGLKEVVNFGFGCCLIKAEVFKKMEQPWVRLGQLNPEHWNDDIEFFNRVRAAGFRLWLDLDIRCGHMAWVGLWPQYDEEKKQWITVYDSNGKGNAAFLAATPEQIYGNDVYEKFIEEHKHLVIQDLSCE